MAELDAQNRFFPSTPAPKQEDEINAYNETMEITTTPEENACESLCQTVAAEADSTEGDLDKTAVPATKSLHLAVTSVCTDPKRRAGDPRCHPGRPRAAPGVSSGGTGDTLRATRVHSCVCVQ